MMNQTYVIEKLAKEHQVNLLKEANAYRTARQVKKGPRVQANQLKHKVAHLAGLLRFYPLQRSRLRRSTVPPPGSG